MDAKRVAIVAGAEQDRDYDPPVSEHAAALETATLLGAALAKRDTG